MTIQGSFGVRRRAGTVLLVLLWSCPLALALDEVLHFDRIGKESGPPPEVITALYQDHTGFVWIGSRDGLLRYDGYSFSAFEHDPADPTSISDNSIRVIHEDRGGNLWIGTNTGGLERLDRATWTFEHFRHDSADPDTISHESIYAVLEDSAGNLWVGTQQGLNLMDPATGTFRRFHANPDEPGSLHNDYIMALHEDDQQRVWVATLGGGLALWEPETEWFRVFRNESDDPRSLGDDRVTTISEDDSGRLLVGTTNGLNVMEATPGVFRRVGHDPAGESGVTHPLVSALAPGPTGKFWIGTFGGGLLELDVASGEFSSWRHRPDRRDSLSADRVMALSTDQAGSLWIGTWGGGVQRVTRSSRTFARRAADTLLPSDIDSEDASGLFCDREGGIWIGTRTGDVLRKAPGEPTYRRYFQGGTSGIARIVAAFDEDPSGRIWIGTSAGVVRLDPVTGDALDLSHDPSDPASIGPGYIKAVLADSSGQVWIGTGEGGLQQIDGDGRVVARYRHDPTDPNSISDDYVTTLYEDRDGTLWVGTRSGGLNALDRGTGRATRYQPDPDDDASISYHYITGVIEDSAGRMWVATGGGGLNRFEGRGDETRFVRFTSAHGLIDDNVMSVVEDDLGTLWLSTKRGLARFDPDSARFAAYYQADGLPSSEFEPASAARDRDVLYFGSVKWIVPVPANSPFPQRHTSRTLVTSISTGAGELSGERPVWERDRLDIRYGEWLSLEITVLDFMAEHNHTYAYRLGDDDAWIDLGQRRAVTFTDLDPGRYEFVARGRNSQGVWSVAEPALQIHVVPPFWMTTWFRAAIGLGVIGLALVAHRLRLRSLERRNLELIRLHEQREKARLELDEAYQRLRVLARRLEGAKEEERKHIARELHDEMGPTLTAVIINLQMLVNKADRERIEQKLGETVELVDRMVQRIRDLSLDLRPPLLDELGLVPALRGYMETQSQRAGIHIDVLAGRELGRLPPEIEIAAFRVAQEATTNVIRHAQATRATIDLQLRDGRLDLSVVDDGSGFDVRKTMEPTVLGKAVGLMGLQERVEMLGGEFGIDSQPGRGTTVRVRLPV